MICGASTVSLPGPLVGVGVDVVVRDRVSARLARAKFSAREVELFQSSREVPFAAREAVLKAVGGPGILRAPLRDMPVAWDDGALVFRPAERYVALMRARGVSGVRLTVLAVSVDHVIVTALAHGDGPTARVSQAYAVLAPSPSLLDALDDDERAECHRRHDPLPSAAARVAAHTAARELSPGAVVRVRGARDQPPRLVGAADDVKLSLAHERDLAVALVAIHRADGVR